MIIEPMLLVSPSLACQFSWHAELLHMHSSDPAQDTVLLLASADQG